jgi:DNA-binding transcriptional regulator YhcF (GntR family)/predicted GIY-YIG superfamily endonuclease
VQQKRLRARALRGEAGTQLSEDRSTSLYRYFDAEGTLLYVGIAYDPDKRKQGHAQTAAESWYPLIAGRTVEFFETREEAEEAEVRAIRSERPRFNRRHSVTREPEVIEQDERLGRRRSRGLGRSPRATQSLQADCYRVLRERIESGYYAAGESLPAANELLRSFGVNAQTLRTACLELEKDGFIRKAGIRGYLVQTADHRRVNVCIGRPEEAAATLRAAMTGEQVDALIRALQQPVARDE